MQVLNYCLCGSDNVIEENGKSFCVECQDVVYEKMTIEEHIKRNLPSLDRVIGDLECATKK